MILLFITKNCILRTICFLFIMQLVSLMQKYDRNACLLYVYKMDFPEEI